MNIISVILKNSTVTRFSKRLIPNFCNFSKFRSLSFYCFRRYNPPTPVELDFLESRHFIHFSTSSFTKMSAKTALVIIANGSEEIEAVTPIDTLRRAGVEVTVAGLDAAGEATLSRNVIVKTEKSLKEALASAPFDAVILPGGGKGSEAFVESCRVGELLKDQEKGGRLIAAICAAPTALHQHDICLGRSLTSYPAMKEKMMEGGKYEYKEERVVVDGNLITSRGPGTSLEFSLAVAAHLVGQEKADEVAKAMLVL